MRPPQFAWPAPLAAMEPNQRNLTLAVGVSLLIHGLALSIHFTYPDALTHLEEQALDVVLVNSKHARRPRDAQAKAQANLDGGGNIAENRRAATPLPPSDKISEGDDLVEAQRRVAELEAAQRQMLTRIQSPRTLPPETRPQEPLPAPTPAPSGIDLANRALAIARLEAQIERQADQYNKLPRKKFVGVRTEEYLPAQYIEDWRQKVERVGNLNYPEAARGKLYGSLVVYVEIDSAGELKRAEVQRPSGHKLLDEAALRIVRMAATNGFGRFSPEMKREFDILAFARTLNFVQSDRLQTR